MRIPKIQEKGGALGETRLIILCLELGVIWLIYLIFGWIAAFEMPLWLSTFIVIAVDRATDAVGDLAQRRRDGLE
ncbi:hypothetical protein SAMN05216376_11494 [Mameliella alba]|uniref:hypothetical protein n=1 Tax=Mameliella TaxID=1434019 RepID=UPI0008888A59|nr:MULTISPECIES: hypothetical protein [Mameliella]MCR9275916.1 hypothetical protein [Paracoccaceae bacterium]OWV44084.1 hypothetical protein CDZ96_21240 [Mameliella alba]OWV61134.1 hypothetical protein CDZ98_08885 [Mameliella alba]PTR36317.1 hypothetical protein LX94_04154 [Mameliella alba]SDD95362.1 hypothetical protein SAMN05216376_11494 [Mameliella alba]